MTDLTDVFELMHGGADSFQTLRATLRTWRDEERQQLAFERRWEAEEAAHGGGAGVSTIVFFGDSEEGEPPTESTETMRVWYEKPSRRREEVEGRHPHVSVADGVKSWTYMPGFGALEQGDQPPDSGGGEIEMLLRPERLLPVLDFEVIGSTEIARRPGIRIRAMPRPMQRAEFFGIGLPFGGDEYELGLDSERGILLGLTATLDGEPFLAMELVEVAFDEPLDPDVFRFEAPEGEPVRSAEEVWGLSERMTSIEEAAERASFVVWIPSRLPPSPVRSRWGVGWDLEVMYDGRGGPPAMPEAVTLFYHHEGGPSLSINERAAGPVETGGPWDVVELEGERYRVWESESRKPPLPTYVRTERDGTEVELSSQELGREDLLEVARSLVRASTEPPSLTG